MQMKKDDLPTYALLNLSLIAREFLKTMEVQGGGIQPV